jgi:hypothetical protein
MHNRIASMTTGIALAIGMTVSAHNAALATLVVPPDITSTCQAVDSLPPIIPDIPGWTGHLTFTNSLLLLHLRSACREQQLAQAALLNLQTTPGTWGNTPLQLSDLRASVAKFDQSLASYKMATQLLNQLDLDGKNLAAAEAATDAARGQSQSLSAGTMVNASAANALLKMETMQATQIQAEQAASQNAASHMQAVMSAPSPDFGDGWML